MYRNLGYVFLFCLISSSNFLFAQNDIAEAKKYIQEMNDKLTSAMIRGEYEAMTDYYADDVISLPSYQPMIKGKNKVIEKTKKEIESGFKVTSAKFKITEVFGSGDHVYEIGEYDMTMVMPEMPQPVSDNGKYLTVWEKEGDGKWKAVAEIWNSNNNPWMEKGTKDKEKK
jgi:ketosteroid isomerase-like protein